MNRVRRVGREAVLGTLFAVLAVAGIAFLIFGAGDSKQEFEGPRGPSAVTGEVVQRDRILSDGGYNTFTGAWLMPNGDVATAWVNVTGTAAPQCRHTEEPKGCSNRGFRGAKQRFVVKRSADNGRTWKRPFADEVVERAAPHAYSGQPTIALKAHDATRAGTLLRRVNGEDIDLYPEFPNVPGTAWLERRAPGEKDFSGRQIVLDPARYTYSFSRIERLHDGKTLLAVGGFWPLPAGTRLQHREVAPQWLLMRSTDEGATWHNVLSVPDAARDATPANEWDITELPGGDLLGMLRTRNGSAPARKQVVLSKTDDEITTNTGEKSDGGWVMGTPILTTPDFEQSTAGVQHPELLYIERGPAAGGLLHIADDAIHYTADGGETWSAVHFPSDWTPHYYPRAVQGARGNIYVFSHAGTDEDYTTDANKPIYLDIIRIVPDRDTGAR